MKEIKIYVDGSWSANNPHVVGWAIVAMDGNKFRGKITGETVSMRNVIGEICAASQAVLYARDKQYDHVIIMYDMEGIEKWANKKWKRNNEYTERYYQFIYTQRKDIKISFQKIPRENNFADIGAKSVTQLIDTRKSLVNDL